MSSKRDFPNLLLTKKAAAFNIGMSEKTLDRRIRSGEFPVIRDGRIIRVHPDDLERYIAAHRSTRHVLSGNNQS